MYGGRAPKGELCNKYVCMYIAHIAGYLISMTIALGPIARLNSLGIYFVIARRGSWHKYVLFLSNCCRN